MITLDDHQRARLWELLGSEPEQAAQLAETLTGHAIRHPLLVPLSQLAGAYSKAAASVLTRARLHYIGLKAEDDRLTHRLCGWLYSTQAVRMERGGIDIDRQAAGNAANWLWASGETVTARRLYLEQVAKRGRCGLRETMPLPILQRHAWPLIEGTADPADWLIKPYRVRLDAAQTPEVAAK